MDSKYPRLLRNQGVRHGSALAGQALYASGGAITARGLSLSRSKSTITRKKSSVVTKRQARTAERMGGQKYNPSKSTIVLSDRRHRNVGSNVAIIQNLHGWYVELSTSVLGRL